MPKKNITKTKKIDQVLSCLEILIRDDFRQEEQIKDLTSQITELRNVISCLLVYFNDLKVFEQQVFIQNKKSHLSEPL